MVILAAFSRHDQALDQAREWGIRQWGAVELESPRFEFVETDYYAASMGIHIKKCLFAFQRLQSPDDIVHWKLAANQAEQQVAQGGDFPEPRPLNLDPGYLTDSKFLLATTKDHAHRIYLGQGIYAEITLRYFHGEWQPWDWTYPDYRREDYRAFFQEARERYRRRKIGA